MSQILPYLECFRKKKLCKKWKFLYGTVAGKVKRVPLETWDAEEAKKKAAEIALAATQTTTAAATS